MMNGWYELCEGLAYMPRWGSPQRRRWEYRQHTWGASYEVVKTVVCVREDLPNEPSGPSFSLNEQMKADAGMPTEPETTRDPDPVEDQKIDLHAYVAAHLTATGACDDADPDGDESLCDAPECTYCQMARACQPDVSGPPYTIRPINWAGWPMEAEPAAETRDPDSLRESEVSDLCDHCGRSRIVKLKLAEIRPGCINNHAYEAVATLTKT